MFMKDQIEINIVSNSFEDFMVENTYIHFVKFDIIYLGMEA